MKRLNFQLFDFLDIDPALPGNERIRMAGKPETISGDNGDIVVSVPFHLQQNSNDYQPEPGSEAVFLSLRIRAYGPKILRLCVGEGMAEMHDSPMIQWHPDISKTDLQFTIEKDGWIINDHTGSRRAFFNFKEPDIDHWSDLIPPPPPVMDLVLYPEKGKEIRINAYDQFFPRRRDALHLAYIEKDGIIDRTTLSIASTHDEVFVGSGERFGKLDLTGRTFQMENQDGQGVNNNRAYKSIPFFMSSRMYGVFMHTSAHSKFSFADHSTRSVQLLNEEAGMDVFFFGGNTLEEVQLHYRKVTGFPSLPPLWSFGTWMSRMTYFSADEVNTICDRLRNEDFPCDVIHLDTGWFRTDWLCEWTFNPERFPDPPAFIKNLRDKGFRVSLWQLPYVAEDAMQLEEAKTNNYIAPLKQSREQGGSNFSALDYAGTIDFTNPEATKWYQGLLRNLLEMGVTCIKTDFGEDIHLEADYQGMDAKLLHNLYPLLYQQAAYEITKEVTGDGIIWARAGWAGCQRFPVHWGGDSACTWDGLAGSLKGGLHIGLSGFGFWSHDVPGFHGIPNFMNSVIPDDLYVRWTQFGVFTSHLRYHGTSKREPYEYPAIAPIVRKWLKLRYALIPYIMEQSRKITETGYPMIRALVFHHPEDKTCWHIHDQYYFGDDFLVAPVMSPDNLRDVYIPSGEWIHLFSGEEIRGPEWIRNLETPLEEMPVWVKKGASVSFYPESVQSTDEMKREEELKIVFDTSFAGISKTTIGQLCNF